MSAPALSYVVAVDRWETARLVAEHLARQARAAEIELVLVGDGRLSAPETAASGLAGVTVVRHPLIPTAGARAAGVRAAAGGVVVIGETHVLPAPGWADALLAAHSGPWVAVTPAIGNANPDGVLSEVALHVDYGRWSARRPRGPVAGVPRNNASFKREELVALGAALEPALEPLGDLGGALRLRGGRAFHEPAARIAHANVSRPRAWLHERYLAGRLVGGCRARRWGVLRRAAYVAALPLIATRVFALAARRLEGESLGPRAGLALAIAAAAQAAGEAVGYATGRFRNAESAMLRYELRKWDYAVGARP